MERESYPDTEAGARECLTAAADPEVLAMADRLVAIGSHRWRADPSVEGVWGLVRTPYNQTADLIVYCTQADFEISDSFERNLRPTTNA